VKLLIFATEVEALPFIENIDMKLLMKKPVRLYTSPDIHLLITGIGKSNAAMSTALALASNRYETILNLGAAGALKPDLKAGEIFTVKKIIEADRPHLGNGAPRFSFPDPVDSFQGKNLATRDIPAIGHDERTELGKLADIIDMEGAAILQACGLFSQKCGIIKFISDTLSDNMEGQIIENIKSLRKDFFDSLYGKII